MHITSDRRRSEPQQPPQIVAHTRKPPKNRRFRPAPARQPRWTARFGELRAFWPAAWGCSGHWGAQSGQSGFTPASALKALPDTTTMAFEGFRSTAPPWGGDITVRSGYNLRGFYLLEKGAPRIWTRSRKGF